MFKWDTWTPKICFNDHHLVGVFILMVSAGCERVYILSKGNVGFGGCTLKYILELVWTLVNVLAIKRHQEKYLLDHQSVYFHISPYTDGGYDTGIRTIFDNFRYCHPVEFFFSLTFSFFACFVNWIPKSPMMCNRCR